MRFPIISIVAGVCFARVLALAQTANGTLTGIITDPTDAVVAEARVTAKSRSTGVSTETRSTAAGVYTISLRPGVYDVMVEAAGFKSLARQGIEINTNQTARVDLRLELGQVAEKVTVEANAPLLQAETSELGMVVRSQMVLDLPLSTPGQRRMADTFTLLVPGVNSGGGSGGNYANLQWDRGGQWTTNGSQENSREILIDGISIGEIHSPGRFWAYSPPPDSIQEFKMLTGSYSAEFGRAAGGVITFTSRSGGNQVHGSTYEFLRNDKAHARGFFTPTKAKDRQNEFGVTLGGPVYIPKVYDGRNKTFFFFFYNGMRWRTASANELITVPRPEFLKGDFSRLQTTRGTPRPIFDPLTSRRDERGDIVRDQFPGNIIPASRISKVSQNIAALLPQPMLPGQTLNFVGVRTTLSDDDRWQIKMDHSFSERQRLSVLFSPGEFVRDGSGPLPQKFFSGFTTRDETARLIRITHDFTISPRLLNHFAAGFNRDAPFTGTTTVGEGWPARLGLRGTADDTRGAFPHILFGSDVDDGIRLSGEANSFQAENSFLFSDFVTLVKGKHSMRFGGEFRKYQVNARVNHRTHGTFSFGSGFTSNPASPDRANTGSGVATFVLGAVNGGTVLYPTVTVGDRYTYYGAFFQDDLKLTRKLTVNLGLRYEVAVPLREVADRISVFDPAAPNPRAGGLPGALIFAGQGPGRNGRKRFADTDFTNWGPRIGFACQVLPRTVLRGGYGIFYGTGGNAVETALGSRLQLGFNAQPTFTSLDPNGVQPAFYWDGGVPQDFPKPPFIDPSFANQQSLGNWIRSEDGRPPYIQNWHFGIQRQITENLVVDAAYVGSKGTRLPSSNLRLNQLHPDLMRLGLLLTADINSAAAREAGYRPPYPGFVGSVAQSLRAFPQYFDIVAPHETLGMSNYNSLQLLVQKRYSLGLTFSTAYTFSKKLGNAGESQVNEQNAGPMDAYNLKLDKALSYNDLTHVLAIGYAYDLPIGRGRRFFNAGPLRKALEGWQISGMSRYQSGPPMRISGGFGTGIFSGNRPTFVPGEKIRTSVSPGDFDSARDVYLNRNAFSNGERFRFGDVPRTVNARSFPFYDESLGILKKTRIFENALVEFRAEFYNLPNRVIFGRPVTDINSLSFGRVSSQLNSPRQMQFGLRLSF